MVTNILGLPLIEIAATTATNESWRDSIAFVEAGMITALATASNAGTGSITALTVAPGAYIGEYTVTMTSATQFRVTDPNGYIVGAGNTGVPFAASAIGFQINIGATSFVTGDTFTLTILPQPFDITGIRFVMSVRASDAQTAATILISGDTRDGTLVNGGVTGVLSFAIPASVMEEVAPSPDESPYVFDALAIADGDQRRCIKGKLAVVSGVTIPTN